MRRGWEVLLKDGTIMKEKFHKWKDVPKAKIQSLSLLYDGRRWDISGKDGYFIRNRVSMIPGVKESMQIERRSIGYYEGADKILYTIDEYTGKFSISIGV